MNAQEELVRELSRNEHVVHLVPLDDLKKEWEARKGAVKQGAGLAAPVADAIVAGRLIRNFGLSPEKVVVKKYQGRSFVILKGRPGERKILKGTRYLASNPKVIRMAVGPRGIGASAKGGFVLTAVLSVGVEIFNYFIKDQATLSELLGTITGDLIKIGLSAIAGAAAGLAVGTAAVVGTVAAAPLIAAIAVGVATGVLLDAIDQRLGATKALIKAYRDLGMELREIEYEAARTLYELENNPSLLMRLFGGVPWSPGGY